MASLLGGICETWGTAPGRGDRAAFPTCHRCATAGGGELADTSSSERIRPMQTPRFTPAFIEKGDFETHAFNDNCGPTVELQPPSRILVALQDPQARRGMSRALRANGYRVITLDEPFAAWGMVAEHASPRLAGFDFVICGGFRSGRGPGASRAPDSGARFFLLLGRHGFVPFAADGTPPPAWAFRRVGTGLSRSAPSGSPRHIGRPSLAPGPQARPTHAP